MISININDTLFSYISSILYKTIRNLFLYFIFYIKREEEKKRKIDKNICFQITLIDLSFFFSPIDLLVLIPLHNYITLLPFHCSPFYSNQIDNKQNFQ